MQHTRRHRVPEHARSVGEHAGVRRAPCDEDACAKLGGAAGWRRSQRGRALYSELWGKWRRLGRARRRKQQRRRGRGRPREAHAAAHQIRIVPVDVPSKADQPRELRLVAIPCGLVHGLAHRVAHRVRRALQAFARSDTCAFGGGHARLRGDAREAAARTPSRRGACSAPTRPSELGWPRQPWREGASRTLAATTARSRGCRNAWLPRPRAAWCGRAKQRAKQAIGLDEGIG